MATLKPPIPEDPYLPMLGINPDVNGLALHPNEAIDMLNLRVYKDKLATRAGTKRLAKNIPGEDPILAFHTMKRPNGEETLFAFTKNTVWKYLETVGQWDIAVSLLIVEAADAVAAWAHTALGNPVSMTAQTGGTIGDYKFGTWDDGTFVDISDSATAGAFNVVAGNETWRFTCNKNLTGKSHLVMWFGYENLASPALTTVSCQFKFYKAAALLGTTTIDVPVTGLTDPEFASALYIPIPAAAQVAGVDEIRCYYNQNFTIPLDQDMIWWIYVLYALGSTPADVEFWHTTDFTDATYGATVVAAGSNPPNPNVAEDDQASRQLMIYDTTNSYFVPLTTYRQVTVGDESTGVNGPAAAGVVVSTAALAGSAVSGFSEIVKGTMEIYTAQTGTLVTCSSILTTNIDGGGHAGYYLIPVDESIMAAGTNSWVRQDGLGWSIEFLNADYSTMPLYALYTYKMSIAYKPRFLWNFHNRLLMANTYESSLYQPWRARWSEVGDADLYVDANYADLVDTDTTSIIGGAPMGFYLNIYKTGCIVKGSYVGGDSIFLFSTVWKDGTFAGRTIQEFEQRQYFLGHDDVYMWDGSGRYSITKMRQTQGTEQERSRIRGEIFNLINNNQINNCFANIFPRYSEYWLWIVESGATRPSTVFVYSIPKDVWCKFEFQDVTCVGNFHTSSGSNGPTINALIGTIDDQGWNFENAGSILEGLPFALVLAYSGDDVFLVDESVITDGGYRDRDGVWTAGTAIASRLITRDFIFGDIPRKDRVRRFDVEALGTSVIVSCNANYAKDTVAFIRPTTLTLTNEFKKHTYFPDVVTEHVRFLLTSAAYVEYRWMIPYAIVQEQFDE